MDKNPLKRIELARVAESKSPHPIHKVGALLCTLSSPGQYQEHQYYNYWPDSLTKPIESGTKLGNASTTVHAEISALIQAKASTNMADIYVTDLPCPNCAKTLAEAGINNVYIDSATHDTPLGIKMKPYFEDISLLMFERAGIGIYEVDLPTRSIATLSAPHSRENELVFAEAHYQNISETSRALFREQIAALDYDDERPFAACIADDSTGNSFLVSGSAHNAMGLSTTEAEKIDQKQDKYEPVLQPFNRLLGQCAYYNLKIRNGYFFASFCPTAREFVNMIGYGLTSITIENPEQCRDKWGLIALKQIHDHNVMKISEG